MTDREDLQRHIDDIDGQLRTLRGESEGVAEQVGGRDEGAQNPEDIAAALTMAEENGALIDALEARRESLVQRLEQR